MRNVLILVLLSWVSVVPAPLRAQQWPEDRDARKRFVAETSDQLVLAKLAMVEEDWEIANTAVDKITDQELLTQVALRSPLPIGSNVVRRLTDPKALAQVALNSGNISARIDAINKISDEAVLKEVALRDSSSVGRADAVARIRDQTFLKELLVNERMLLKEAGDPTQRVWRAACRQIEDSRVLLELARSSSPSNYAALERVSEQAQLADAARSATSREIRLEALRRLTDGQLQAQIALADADPYVREKVTSWPLRVVGVVDTSGLAYQGLINVYFVPVDEQGGMLFSYSNGRVDNLAAELAEDYKSELPSRRPKRVSFALEIPVDNIGAGQRFTLAVGYTAPGPPGSSVWTTLKEELLTLRASDGKASVSLSVDDLTRFIDVGTLTVASQ